ncbi:hypothetical protein AB0911_07805 [Streptomyces nigra]|uniref:hypothetical protein n=1 Tax=Streptomyces nigra TaxID=1827580 RepID=UPI003453B0CD
MQSVAPFVAAVRRRLVNLPGPARSAGVASTGEPVTVELLVGGAWVDLTAAGYVMVRDDSGQIRITYGIQGGEGSQTERASAQLQLRNTDGRFSHRNPTGPYYDTLNWNAAQIRVSVPDGNGGKSYRTWGEVSEWAPNSDRSGNDVWVDSTVSGIMQKLAQAPAPERSAIYRAVTTPELTGLVAYWPCEDPTEAKALKSALLNGSAMTWTGVPVLAAYDAFGGSDPLPTLTGASLTGGVTKYDTTTVTQYQLRYLLAVPAAGFSDLDVLSRITVDQSAYNLRYLDIHYNDPPGGIGSFGGRGTLTILLKDGDQNDLATSGTSSLALDVRGRRLRVSLEVANNGTALAVTLRVLDVDSGVTDSTTVGLVSTQVTRVITVDMAPDTLDGDAGVVGAAVGHVMLQTTVTDIGDLGEAIQPSGEAAGRRIQRLCGDEAIPFEWVGDLDDTVLMGGQGRENLLSLVQEACLADGGLLYETRTGMGLGYRTRASLHNQDPALVLSYPGFNLAEVPVPVDDDRQVQNILTVTVDGVSATYEETDGPLGTRAVGKYGENNGLTLNLAASGQATLLDQAAWRVHLGTVDEDRFPKISVNLAHSSITPDMRRAILALRLGDRIQITGTPSWISVDTVDQLLLGIEETITHFEHRLTFTCAPASPYTVGVLDSPASRLDTDGSELRQDIGSGTTSFDVVPSAGEDVLWVTDSAEFPFDVRVGGEVMRVTSIGNYLTDTFARTSSNSWGTADTGQTYSTGGGTAADYQVTGGYGAHVIPTANASRRTYISTTVTDFDYYVDVTTPATPTGNSVYGGPTGRYHDVDNLYMARIEFTTSSTLILNIRKRVGGNESQLGTYTLPDTFVAGTYYRIRWKAEGALLRAKAWLATDIETPEWQVSVTDTSITTTSFIGVRSIIASGNTNVNPEVRFQNLRIVSPQTFTVTRSINGVTKSHAAGTDVRLATPTILSL